MTSPLASAHSKGTLQESGSQNRCTTLTLDRVILFFSRHWLMWFNLAVGLWVVLPWAAPILMHIGATGPAYLVYKFYSFQCHQLPQRSYFLFGAQFMIPLDDILAAQLVSDPVQLAPFIGTAELGWKVAWSDRMVHCTHRFSWAGSFSLWPDAG